VFRRLAQFDIIEWWPGSAPAIFVQTLFGLAVTLVVIMARFGVDLVAPAAGAFALVYPATMIATLFGRWQAGAVTGIISFIWTTRFVVPRTAMHQLAPSGDISRTMVNGLSILTVVIFAELFRSAVRAAAADRDVAFTELAARKAQLQELNDNLEARVADRTRALGQTWTLSPDLLSVLGADGAFETSNPAWETLLGWPPGEIQGARFFGFIHPDDLERTQDAWAMVNAGQPEMRFDARYRRKGGGWAWLSWVVVPEDGKFYASARDVTLEKEQAAALAKTTADRDRMWRHAQDVISVVDMKGIITSVNPAAQERLGWAADELEGKPCMDFIHPDDLPPMANGLFVAERYQTPKLFRNRFRHKNGDYRWMSWFASMYDGHIYSSGRDVTVELEQAAALSRAEEQLRQSQKMEAVGQLTGGLAHDFNNLLTGLSGSLERMQTRLAQGRVSEIGRYVSAAQGAAERAAALTHRLLAFSRRQTLDPRPVNVNRLVADMEDMIRRAIGPQIDLEVVGAPGLWTTLIDPNQLENALLNLCINARDAMPEGGRITIETANARIDDDAAQAYELSSGEYLSLSVTDTGTGMTPDVAARAFDPFFTTKPLGAGTGLGLSMIYGFARQSGGQVKIYSEVGVGTTMRLYLPRSPGAPEEVSPPRVRSANRQSPHGETVLIVDDEPAVRMLIVEVLEEAGYRAIEADDGPGGLRVLETGTEVDLLITDVGLPGGMNGRQVADAARALRPDLKVLFITGYAENAVIGNGHLESGAAILTKPFALDTLSAKITEIMA
jgi:PAS domain S-box-containing protein